MNDRDNPSSSDDISRAQELASRYRCEFVDLHAFKLQLDIVGRVPAHLMFRYNFVPLEEAADGRLAIAIADPSQLMMIDEISLLLGRLLIIRVSSLAQINEILQGGIDPLQLERSDQPPDGPLSPGAPEAPIFAPKRPRPNLRSGAAGAIPEKEQ